MELIIKNSRVTADVIGKTTEFPKYTTQIMNLANQNAQGTRPNVVGQMSELIEECPKGTYDQ
jgi:MjaI restriction endonuclease